MLPDDVNPKKRPLENQCESGPPTKQRNLTENNSPSPSLLSLKNMRLPMPCPLPTTFSGVVMKAISDNMLKANMKTRLIRECTSFYLGLCPYPRSNEYIEMAKTICNKYPELQDINPKNGEYWVNVHNIKYYENSRNFPFLGYHKGLS